MGTKLKEIIKGKEIEVKDLSNKTLVVDSYNTLYQFLSSIRQRDGTLLMDSQGNITSHLVGLFSRTLKLMQNNIKLAFVFDGEPPKLKGAEKERRKELKEKAVKQYEIAKERGDLEEMKKYASRTTVLDKSMVDEAKELVKAMGMPFIQAPSEGEAQAAHMVKKGSAFAEVSQDFDCLMYGVPRLVRNLTISEKKKLPGKLSFQTVKPEIIDLQENLDSLGINNDELIVISILVGTDYNLGGVKGIGPKNALKLVKECRGDFEGLFKKVEWEKHFDFSWEEVFDLIKKMPVEKDYRLEWKPLDRKKIIKLLCEKHDFSLSRVESSLEKMDKEKEKRTQKGLGEFI